ncbi:MAG: hypothetical protein D6714_13595 [Bacteroidetes bacterium]|nr:MAG: hypothetical protein D6714_13595 [Bacteroidota bacterium]
MPKTPSAKLFDLIKSLSGSEKRYFKIFANTRAGRQPNKYIQLFDAIDQQEVFDDADLKAQIYGNTAVESRKYSELKAYLYELILKSLQSFDEKTSVDFRLKNLLQNVRVLFKRSHFEDCKSLLKKAKALALRYEQFNAVLEVLNWEKVLASAETDISFLDRELPRINEEEEWCLQRLQNISEYRNIFFKLLLHIRKDVSRRKEQLDQLKTIIDHPLLENYEQARSHTAQVLFYRIFSVYYFSISDSVRFYETSKTLIHLLESKAYILREDVSEYISVLNNHVVSCGRMGKIRELEETLEKFLKIKPVTLDDELKIIRQYYMGKFRLCINSGNFIEGHKALVQFKEKTRKFDQSFFQSNTFYLQHFTIYFGIGDYTNALHTLNEWLGIPKNVERKDLQSLSRILNLIIHYELGNQMLLESLLRSTHRFLSKEKRLFEFEKKFLSALRDALKPRPKKEVKKIFETLKKDFEDSSAFIPEIFGMFDMVAWLESKIREKPFAEIVRSRFQNWLDSKVSS